MQCFRCLQKIHPAPHCTKQLPIQIVKNKVMTANISKVNQVNPPILARQQVKRSFHNYQIETKKSFKTLNNRIEEMDNK